MGSVSPWSFLMPQWSEQMQLLRYQPAVSPSECAWLVMWMKSGKRSGLTIGSPLSVWYVYLPAPCEPHCCQLSSSPTSQ